ncbi:acyl carrier protein [Nitrospinaceae bacterium]|nr:acyl carrier protein [Nitrospinaceae bacterium]
MEIKLREIVAEAIDVNLEELTDQSSPDNMPEWDSFAHMTMVAALEGEFKISLTLEEIMEMQNIQKIKEVISRKL